MRFTKITIIFLIFIQLMIPLKILASETEKEIIPLLPENSRTSIYEHLYILEDKEKKWDIHDVRSEPLASSFQKNTMKIPNFGYTSSAYWTYFEIENKTIFTERMLEIPYPPLKKIDIYLFDRYGEQLEEIHIGSAYPFKERPFPYPDFAYIFDIEENERFHFYIRFETEGSMQMPIIVWEQQGYVMKKQQDFLYYGIFYGVTGVMVFYNLFLFFALRHVSYLFYVLLVMTISMVSLCLNGIAFQYLWSESPWWNMRSIVFFMSIAAVLGLLFTDSFLDLKRNLPKWRKYLFIFLIINILNAIFVFISYQIALNFLVLSVATMIIFIILVASFALIKGVRQARFFIVSWTIFLIGILISMLADAAIIPLTPLTQNIWQGSVALEVVLLSFALADRINILQKEKNDAVQQSYKSQRIAIENLRRADQLKDEFLAMTSHELKTPLNGIVGIAETLQDGAAGKVSKDMHKHLSLIILSGKRLFNLINDILDFSKLKNEELQLSLEPLNIKEITDVVLMVCTPLIKDKNIQLLNQIESSTPLVFADENRVQQILYNLIGNAIKFTDNGVIIISAEEHNDKVKISVTDTGKGIPTAELPFIFEQFHQIEFESEHVTGGSGIGLSITKKLVELHEGEITVESELNKGTTFHFTLLKSKEEVITKKEIASSIIPQFQRDEIPLMGTAKKAASSEDRSTILIADDEMVNLQVLVHQLTLDGYHVVTAKDGEEVLQEVEENEFDIIILDIMMPKISGYEVCRRLRKTYSLMELPILMLTAKNQLQDKLTSFEVGANDYLSKPCERKELLSRVKTLVQLSHLNKQLIQFNRVLEDKVTERTTELKLANDKLIDVMKSRQRLLANISHELGTPVTLIHGYVQAIRDGLIPADEKSYLQIVFDKVTLLTRLIDDLADLSKLEAGQLRFDIKKVNLQKWVNDVNQTYELEVTEAKRLYQFKRKKLDDFSNFTCEIDVERMNQVFSNLIWNAIKHTEEQDGKISIYVRVSENEREVVFEIQDNGYGIPQENLPYIFERFYKGADKINEKASGTGLGLTIVKEIIQAHHGTIWVESEIDKGTVFYVALPIHKEKV